MLLGVVFLEYKYKNIKEMLYDVCNKYNNKTAFINLENKEPIFISYRNFFDDLNCLGTGIKTEFPKAKKIVIIGKNSYNWALSFLTSMCSDVITIPLDKELSDIEIIRCINRVEADTIIYSEEFNARVSNIKKELTVQNYISMDTSEKNNLKELIELGQRELNNGNRKYIDIQIKDNETTELLFTSGTTSESKIVMLSHYNIITNAQGAKEMIAITDSDTFFSLLPLHHTFENTCGLITPLCSGSTIAYNDSLKNILINLKKIHPTILLVVPRFMEVFYDQIVKGAKKKKKLKLINFLTKITSSTKNMNNLKRKIYADIHNEFGGKLSLFVIGGAAANPRISKFMRSLGFSVLQGYGLTECSPLVSVNKITNFKDDSVGFAVPNTKVCINNPNADGVGEIKISGPQVMKGYYNDDKATEEVIKNDGFFYTGDLGYIDNRKFIMIKGRIKNLIITSNGKNIYPEELEKIINENDIIKESLVHLTNENENNITKLLVEIVLTDQILEKIKRNPDYNKEITKIIAKYIKEVNQNLPDYKKINDFVIREDEFEKTTTLKIKRYKI